MESVLHVQVIRILLVFFLSFLLLYLGHISFELYDFDHYISKNKTNKIRETKND